MAVERIEERPTGTVTLHGCVGDYGITLHLTAAEYQTIVRMTDNEVQS
jgi:hypothetical protein